MIKKAIIPIAGLGTRFFPLSNVVSKELWPLVDKPTVQYVIEEAIASGIEQIIFVVNPEKKLILDYFKKPSQKLEKILKERKKDQPLELLKNLQELLKNVSFSFVLEKEPLGDGHAVLQAQKMVGNEPFAVLFDDDIVESKTPCLLQLAQVFKTCQRSVLSLHQIPRERISSYGIVNVEKITNRLYKVKKIVEKPAIEEAFSNLAIVGKYIFTPEIFDYLKSVSPNQKGEIILADALEKMIEDGKIVYSYEFEGEWWECGNIEAYLKSNLYFSLKHPKFGTELKKFLKEII